MAVRLHPPPFNRVREEVAPRAGGPQGTRPCAFRAATRRLGLARCLWPMTRAGSAGGGEHERARAKHRHAQDSVDNAFRVALLALADLEGSVRNNLSNSNALRWNLQAREGAPGSEILHLNCPVPFQEPATDWRRSVDDHPRRTGAKEQRRRLAIDGGPDREVEIPRRHGRIGARGHRRKPCHIASREPLRGKCALFGLKPERSSRQVKNHRVTFLGHELGRENQANSKTLQSEFRHRPQPGGKPPKAFDFDLQTFRAMDLQFSTSRIASHVTGTDEGHSQLASKPPVNHNAFGTTIDSRVRAPAKNRSGHNGNSQFHAADIEPETGSATRVATSPCVCSSASRRHRGYWVSTRARAERSQKCCQEEQHARSTIDVAIPPHEDPLWMLGYLSHFITRDEKSWSRERRGRTITASLRKPCTQPRIGFSGIGVEADMTVHSDTKHVLDRKRVTPPSSPQLLPQFVAIRVGRKTDTAVDRPES